MQTIADRTFRRESLFVERFRFVRCQFIECQLYYLAEEQTAFEDCTFEECEWTFDGPAENQLVFLSDLYHGLGEEGQRLVESIFDSIRSGTVKQATTALRFGPTIALQAAAG
jgi:hypothetical protein